MKTLFFCVALLVNLSSVMGQNWSAKRTSQPDSTYARRVTSSRTASEEVHLKQTNQPKVHATTVTESPALHGNNQLGIEILGGTFRGGITVIYERRFKEEHVVRLTVPALSHSLGISDEMIFSIGGAYNKLIPLSKHFEAEFGGGLYTGKMRDIPFICLFGCGDPKYYQFFDLYFNAAIRFQLQKKRSPVVRLYLNPTKSYIKEEDGSIIGESVYPMPGLSVGFAF